MVDYILNRDENGMVRYLYGKDRKYPYVGKTKWESARWMLENDRSRELRMSEEYEGFPLTADGVYFFDGAVAVDDGDGGTTSSVTADAVPPDARRLARAYGPPETQAAPAGEGFGDGALEAEVPVCGPDWCEIPELAEKPKRKRAAKKAKEVVDE